MYGPYHDSALRREPIGMTAKTRRMKTLRASERETEISRDRYSRTTEKLTGRFNTEDQNNIAWEYALRHR